MPTTSTVDGTAMPAGTDAFSPNVQLKAYQDAAALYNGRKIYATTTAMNLETYMVNGWKAYVTADNSEWWYDGTTWNKGSRTNLQLDTTNSVISTITQMGFGKIIGNGTAEITETVTFPVAFGVIPAVVPTFIGYRATGAYNLASLSASSPLITSAQSPSTTTFNMKIAINSGTLSASLDWYYNWVAFGVPA